MSRPLAFALVIAAIMALPTSASADIPNPPPECVGKAAGDACSFQSGDTGLCQMQNGELTCIANGGSGGDSSDDSSDDEDDGGCALAPEGKGSTGAWLLLGLAGLAAARRRGAA